jgi:hypothetical protein
MPDHHEIVINRLTITWQDQNWVVVAPDDQVIAQFQYKEDAIIFAEQNFRYQNEESITADTSDIFYGEEYPYDLPISNDALVGSHAKQKNEQHPSFWKNIPWRDAIPDLDAKKVGITIGGILTVVIILSLLIRVIGVAFPVVKSIVEAVVSNVLFKVSVVGLIAIFVIALITAAFEESKLLGFFRLFLLLGFMGLLYAVGIIEIFLSWLF